jgi:hypothetical protein
MSAPPAEAPSEIAQPTRTQRPATEEDTGRRELDQTGRSLGSFPGQ